MDAPKAYEFTLNHVRDNLNTVFNFFSIAM
jgi:hypothetical protein